MNEIENDPEVLHLKKFYGVDTAMDVIRMQLKQITRLQDRINDPLHQEIVAVQHVREAKP